MNAAATSLGGMLGGALGGVGDILSAPRRGLMSLLGMPESGADLLSDTFGMDRQSALTKALGIGAEMALDPLTYAGMFAAGPLGRLASAPWRRGAQVDDAIAGLGATRATAQQALAEGNAVAQELRAAVPQVAGGFDVFDLPGVAAGQAKSVKYASPQAVEGLGALASPMDQGASVMGGLASNRGLPGGLSYKGVQGPGGRMMGTGLTDRSFARPLPLMGPEDVAFLQGQAGAGQSELARQLAVEQLGRALPRGPVPGLGGLDPRQALAATEETLPWLMAQARRYQLDPSGVALAGLSGGAAAGTTLGMMGV
jgi:hypothetical protein